MKIAYGNSRMDKRWKNNDISWDDFCKRVSTTQRTTETVDEYRRMKKGEQDGITESVRTEMFSAVLCLRSIWTTVYQMYATQFRCCLITLAASTPRINIHPKSLDSVLSSLSQEIYQKMNIRLSEEW